MSDKLKAYLAIIKVAGGAVLAAEVTAPANATGADRLDIAKSALEIAYPEVAVAGVAFDTLWPMVKPFIDALVAKYKTVPVAVVKA